MSAGPDLTWTFGGSLRFISDLHYGRVTPRQLVFKLRETVRPSILQRPSRGLTSAPDVAQAIASAEPAFYHYELLKAALARLQRLAQQG